MARVGTGAGWVGPWVGVRPGVGWWEGVFEKTSCGDYWISPSHENNFSIRSYV
jgi:hypothetical protein